METNHLTRCFSRAAIAYRLNLILFSLIISLASCDARAQKQEVVLEGKWYLEMEHNDIGLSQVVMEFKPDKAGRFEAHTRKGALKDILGGWNALLARTFTNSFKGGSLLRIEQGIYSEAGNDTLRFAGILTSAVGSYNIEGYAAHDGLQATISNKSGYKGTLKGQRKAVKLPLADYPALFEKAVSLTEDKIYNKALLETEDWKNFTKNMRRVSAKAQDDLEMVFAFYYYAGKLPVSHYTLMKPFGEEENGSSSKDYTQRVFLEEKSPQTAYLKITSFSGSAAEMDSVFAIIRQKGYKNLIVDLRNNPGGSVEAGMAFATNVADTTFYGGVFLTQKYFNGHNALPTVDEYTTFPHFTAANYDLLMEGIHNTKGLCLKIVPDKNNYTGKLYILTNGNTGSTCEPIAYALKMRKRAMLIGETTAGAMLTGEMFVLGEGFKLFLPTADYYAADGYRIDQKGVVPDVEVKQEEALDYVLKLVN